MEYEASQRSKLSSDSSKYASNRMRNGHDSQLATDEELPMDFGNVLVLGVGNGNSTGTGAQYKIRIFEKLRPLAKELWACDLHKNELAPVLLGSKVIDRFFSVPCLNPDTACKELIEQLENAKIRPDVVISFRDDWLQLRTLVALHYRLPHPPLAANQNTQNKYKAKEILQSAGIESVTHQISTFENLARAAFGFGFPLFVKPLIGNMSDWARWISDENALNQYLKDIKQLTKDYAGKKFLLEEALVGHEVDADIVLYDGHLVYAGVSDNFPVNVPYALETGQLTPSILPAVTQDAIIQHAYKAALACGYDRGVLHVELMLKSDGDIALIEVNGRLGGMYISRWHEEIWGVDLVRAELAISAGRNPAPFLQKLATPKIALAQLCVTTQHDQSSDNSGSVEVLDWVNFQDFKTNHEVYHAEKWISFPFTKEIAINGHESIGAITVAAETPLLAFQKLVTVFESCSPIILTDKGVIQASVEVLNRFCFETPGVERFIIKAATDIDVSSIKSMIPIPKNLTMPARIKQPVTDPNTNTILVVEDAFSPDKRVIGTLAPAEQRKAKVSDAGCAHDLVVHSDHQGNEAALIKVFQAISNQQVPSPFSFRLGIHQNYNDPEVLRLLQINRSCIKIFIFYTSNPTINESFINAFVNLNSLMRLIMYSTAVQPASMSSVDVRLTLFTKLNMISTKCLLLMSDSVPGYGSILDDELFTALEYRSIGCLHLHSFNHYVNRWLKDKRFHNRAQNAHLCILNDQFDYYTAEEENKLAPLWHSVDEYKLLFPKVQFICIGICIYDYDDRRLDNMLLSYYQNNSFNIELRLSVRIFHKLPKLSIERFEHVEGKLKQLHAEFLFLQEGKTNATITIKSKDGHIFSDIIICFDRKDVLSLDDKSRAVPANEKQTCVDLVHKLHSVDCLCASNQCLLNS